MNYALNAPQIGDCGDCPIRFRAVCSRCEADELSYLSNIKTYKVYQAGETLQWAGDEIKHFGSIVTGSASISQTLEDGRRQMVGILLPSDFIGRPGRDTSPFDITAMVETVVCRFRRTEFEALVEGSSAVSHRLLEMTLDELEAARLWMTVLGRKSAREKVASFLSIIAGRRAFLAADTQKASVTFELPMTREAIADYLGLTIETISRQFSALKKAGIIELQGARHVRVPDYHVLREAAGDDPD